MDNKKTDQPTEAPTTAPEQAAADRSAAPKVMDVQPPTITEPQVAATDTSPATTAVTNTEADQADATNSPTQEKSTKDSPETPTEPPAEQPTEDPKIAQAEDINVVEQAGSQGVADSEQPEVTATQSDSTGQDTKPTAIEAEPANEQVNNEDATADRSLDKQSQPAEVTAKKQSSHRPVKAIATIVVVTILLAVLAVFAFLNSAPDTVGTNDATNNDASNSQIEADDSAQLPTDPNAATDEVIQDIDQAITTLDEDADYNDAELADQNLEL